MFLIHSFERRWLTAASRIYLEFLVLSVLHHLAPSSVSSAQQGITNKPIDKGGPLSCSNETEFSCSINNICIPIEWRCDFIEQCLDGQDEFGCPAESCDFGHDLCNWWNRGSQQTEVQGSTASHGTHIKRIWRRYSNKSHKKWNNSDGLRPTKEGLELTERSNWLLDKLEPHQGFVFVPLSLSPQFLNTTDSSPITSSLASNNNHLNKLHSSKSWRQEAKSSRLVAPYLGRSTSACQLRFKYVLLSNIMAHQEHRQHHHDHATGSTNSQTPKFNISLSLRLIERQTKARPAEPLSFAGLLGPPVEQGERLPNRSSPERIVWQKTVDTSNGLSTPSSEDKHLSSDWLVGVAELGRIQQIELYFEAILVGRLSYGEAIQLRLLEERRREQGEARLMHASMVALTELNFRSCAWPQTFDSNRLEQASSSLDDEWELETGNGIVNEQQEGKGRREEEKEEEADEDEGEERKEVGRECMQDEFKCSNGICVPGYRLCNFVDDCMASADGQKPEDEAHPLCASVPGMQDFEMAGLKGAHLYEGFSSSSSSASSSPTESANSTNQWLGEVSTFWSLTSNWLKEGISVQNSLRGEAHLPLHDHTLRSPRGHYLSFELPSRLGRKKPHHSSTEGPESIPEGSVGQSTSRDTASENDDYDNNSNNIFWIYLDSPWMRKKGTTSVSMDTNSNYTSSRLPSSPAECRVKFFYNIVVDNPWALEASPNISPFRMYLALEHFALVYDSVDHIVSNSRQLDMFTHSELHEIESSMLARSDGFIEHPGTDFWREVNYKLRNLNESDLFYLRIAIVAEPIHSVNNVRVTINLDDLATHFGCAQIYEDSRDELNKYHRGRGFNLSNYFRSQTHTSDPRNTNIRFAHKRKGQLTPVQIEPQKLIIYVFLVLSGIVGLILLIVFVTVPYVERFTINYHDQLNGDLSQTTDSTADGSSMFLDTDGSHHICQLATVSSTVDESWETGSSRASKSAASSRHTTRHSSIMTMSDC